MFIELKKVLKHDLRVAVSLFTSTKSFGLSTKVRVVNHYEPSTFFMRKRHSIPAVSRLIKKFGSTVLTDSLKTLSGKDDSTAR